MNFIFTKINNQVKVSARFKNIHDKSFLLRDIKNLLESYLNKGFNITLEINGVVYKNVKSIDLKRVRDGKKTKHSN